MKERLRPEVGKLVAGTRVPKMFKVHQIFPRPRIEIEDIPKVVEEKLSQENIAGRIKPGMHIAITVGSRGVANVALITKSIASFVKSKGAYPFVVPAMGSHAGATAEGQRGMIAGYGVTEDYIGCPIVSSMEVKKIGVNAEGVDVFIDKHAAEADGIIVSCRVKPHTAFRGRYESGIMKMMTIGLGKQYGAQVCHASGFKNMAKNVELFGHAILQNAPILFAVPCIENAYEETYRIEAVAAEDVETVEPELLKDAYAHMGRILLDDCDVLIVDQIGKDISGDGMDPNVSGTFGQPYATGGINAQRVCVLDLTDKTHGNALGIGTAQCTTTRVVEKMDLVSMYINSVSNTVLNVCYIPIVMESDKECIQLGIQSCNEIDQANPRIVRIQNTAHIENIMFSEALYDYAKSRPDLEILSEPEDLPFNEDGDLW